MPSQPLSERRRLHVDPPRSHVQVLLSEEIQRDALWAQYAPIFPVILQSSWIIFLCVIKRLFAAVSKRCLIPPQQQTGFCVHVVVVIELWVSLRSSLSISRQPKKPETNHPVFKTLISALITVIISEDVQTSWIKVKKFQIAAPTSLFSHFSRPPCLSLSPHASCVLFRKVLWNHTPPLLWRQRVLGPNTPPERGTVHVRGRGNQVWKSPLHK